MRLKNKKTGEIREASDVIIENLKKNGSTLNAISIDEVRNEWEDVLEEPKEYWAIDCFSPDGLISEFTGSSSDILENRKTIDNYFETREEAEKAVEKLKAYKRLKDKGFKFEGWTIDDGLRISICTNTDSDGIYDDDKKEMRKDLDICFGGEE